VRRRAIPAIRAEIKFRLKVPEKRTEVFFDSAVRRRGEEEQVARGIRGEISDQFIVLLLRLALGVGPARPGCKMPRQR